jgi:hypothetical protein
MTTFVLFLTSPAISRASRHYNTNVDQHRSKRDPHNCNILIDSLHLARFSNNVFYFGSMALLIPDRIMLFIRRTHVFFSVVSIILLDTKNNVNHIKIIHATMSELVRNAIVTYIGPVLLNGAVVSHLMVRATQCRTAI